MRLRDGTLVAAEYKEAGASAHKVWQSFPSDRPDEERNIPVILDSVVAFRPASEQMTAMLVLAKTTAADRIENAYQSYQKSAGVPYTVPVPERRRLKVGDIVELGMLSEAKVADIRNDGQTIICSYQDSGKRHGQAYDNGTGYLAAHWSQVVPLTVERRTRLTRPPVLLNTYRSTTLRAMMHKVRHGLNPDPVYQRGYVWGAQDKQNYLESVFEGGELGRFLIVMNEYPALDDVLDGKQRLNCLCEFFESRIGYKGVFYEELSKKDRAHIDNRSLQFAELPANKMSKVMMLETFLRVNAAGVPQSEEHLTHVRQLLKDELGSGRPVNDALAVLKGFPQGKKVADLYDDEGSLRDALETLFPGFEYPDFSYLTMTQVVTKANRSRS